MEQPSGHFKRIRLYSRINFINGDLIYGNERRERGKGAIPDIPFYLSLPFHLTTREKWEEARKEGRIRTTVDKNDCIGARHVGRTDSAVRGPTL